MAVSINANGGRLQTTNASSYASNAFTPTANSFLVLYVSVSDSAEPNPAVTNTGTALTWTKQATQSFNGGADTVWIFTAPVPSTVSSSVITVTLPSDAATGCIMQPVMVLGYSTSNPIAQIVTNSGTSANPSFTRTAANTLNAYIAAFTEATRTTPSSTAPASWFEVLDSGYNSPATGVSLAYRAGGETSTSVTFTCASSTWGGAYVEINAAETTVSQALTGLSSVTESGGTLTPQPRRAYVSWAQLEVPDVGTVATALTGLAATSAKGTATSNIGPTLTGQSATASQGSLYAGTPLTGLSVTGSGSVDAFFGGPKRAYVSWAEVELPDDNGLVSAALTGLSVTPSQGTITSTGKRAYVSWAQVQLPASTGPSVALTGQAVTASIGTLSAVIGPYQELTGLSVTASAGSLAQGRGTTLVGQVATATTGTLIAAEENYALAGLMVPTVTRALTGLQSSAAYGAVIVVADGLVTIAPVVSGTLTAYGGAPFAVLDKSIGGFAGVSLFGMLTPVINPIFNVTLTGLEVTATAGLPIGSAPQNVVNVILDGLEATAGYSNVVIEQVYLAGHSMSALHGQLHTDPIWTIVTDVGDIWTPRTNASTTWA